MAVERVVERAAGQAEPTAGRVEWEAAQRAGLKVATWAAWRAAERAAETAAWTGTERAVETAAG